MTPILVFDIETIPDIDGLRQLHELDADLSPDAVAEFAFQRRRQQTGGDFLPHHVQRVCAISCVLRTDDGLRAWSIGKAEDDEKYLIQQFFKGIEKYTPQLVSWNGGGFDLPVLNYRALVHGVAAPRYWDMGEDDRDFKWNNYISRYHTRHLDLMDLLAMYQPRASAPLDALAQLCGFPGKLGMDGGQVWSAYQRGELQAIRDYCETDVMNTYLVFLRFQLMRGALNEAAYQAEEAVVRDFLKANSSAEHWQKFRAAWKIKLI
ncbi:MAG: 3'-5' exonuclease [Rhodocyclaceae bacterium]|nr:3'-5' exonuclease [Rhodocyclaceae bacterium]